MRAVHYCFSGVVDKSVLRSVAQFVRNLGDKVAARSNLKKHPVILILDDVSTINFFSYNDFFAQQKSK